MFLSKKLRIYYFYELLFWSVSVGFPIFWSIRTAWKWSAGPSKKMIEMRRMYKERVVHDELDNKTWK
jgi:hypothetical protein